MQAQSFLVCAHLKTCARAHALSLEGTLLTTSNLHTIIVKKYNCFTVALNH